VYVRSETVRNVGRSLGNPCDMIVLVAGWLVTGLWKLMSDVTTFLQAVIV